CGIVSRRIDRHRRGMPVLAFNSHVYDTLKFVHVLAAITWVGSAIYAQVLATRALRQDDSVHLGIVAKEIGELGKYLITPATLVVITFAIATVAYSPAWNFTDTWILIALVGYAATLVTGAGFLGPESARLGKMAAEGHTPAEPEMQGRIRRVVTVARIDLVVLIVVVADMVFKPGT
ncbi:MAG: DUF2269 family protein, partial [Actinomycetota bacterium]